MGKLDKFEARSSDGIFLGYANHSKAHCVLNLETNQIMESLSVQVTMKLARRSLRIKTTTVQDGPPPTPTTIQC
jgi:hypothetical protein